MKKLTPVELRAVAILQRKGPIVLTMDGNLAQLKEVAVVMDRLVRKGRAEVEATDVGPRYSLTAAGLYEDVG